MNSHNRSQAIPQVMPGWQAVSRTCGQLRPEWVLVLLGGVFGLVSAIVTPPIQAPDETKHFYRAWQISEGVVIPRKIDQPPPGGSTGGDLPPQVRIVEQYEPLKLYPTRKVIAPVANLRRFAAVTIAADERAFVSFSNTAAYSPVPYLPQAAGIALGRLLTGSPILLTYCARLANLAVWLAVMHTAIRVAPFLKWSLVAFALLPMSLFLAASASGDALTNALAFMVSAWILRLVAADPAVLSPRDAAVLVLLGLLLSLVKVPYQLVVGLSIGMSGRPDSRDRAHIFWTGALLVAMVLGFGGWMLAMRGTFSPYYPSWRPAEHLRHVLTHPSDLCWGTFGYLTPHFLWRTITQFIGVLGSFDVEFPTWFYLGHALSLALVAATDPLPLAGVAERRLRVTAGGLWILACWTVCFIVLVAGTGIGQHQMFVQGRYFLPLAPLLVVAVAGVAARADWIVRWRDALRLAWAIYLPASLAFMVWTIRWRYYT